MIELQKTTSDWREWVVKVNGEPFILGEHGSKYNETTFNFNAPDDCQLDVSMLETLGWEGLPPELILNFNNVDERLGRYVLYISLCTSPTSPYCCYVWEIEPQNYDLWFNPYLLRDEILKKIVEKACQGDTKRAQASDDFGAAIYFEFEPRDFSQDLISSLNRMKTIIDDAIGDSERVLAIGGFSNKVIATFDIDPSYQHACTSYLIFFTEFLRDLGISAQSKLDVTDEKVLLSVIPNSKDESLQLISEALSLYLKSSKVNTDQIVQMNLDPLTEFKLDKFKTEIDRLQSNLRAAESLIKYQDRLLLSTNIGRGDLPKTPLEGLVDVYVDEKKQDKKEFLNGGIKLGVFNKAGIEFDWGRLIDFILNKK